MDNTIDFFRFGSISVVTYLENEYHYATRVVKDNKATVVEKCSDYWKAKKNHKEWIKKAMEEK